MPKRSKKRSGIHPKTFKAHKANEARLKLEKMVLELAPKSLIREIRRLAKKYE